MITKQVTTLARYSHALMILTTIHHMYGAFVFDTPWRLHALFISIPVLFLTLALQTVLVKYDSARNSFLFWFFVLITLVPSMGMIGIVEGLYNHGLKNVLFFGGASMTTLERMFPAPTYEMPNDFLFEATGALQGLMVVPMIVQFWKLFGFANVNAK